jgi:hypothetical protein
VRIEEETEKLLKTSFVRRALKRKETLESAFCNLRVIILLISVQTLADRIGSSSPRTCADVSVSLVEASSWRCVAWLLVQLASTQHGRVHSARRSRSC